MRCCKMSFDIVINISIPHYPSNFKPPPPSYNYIHILHILSMFNSISNLQLHRRNLIVTPQLIPFAWVDDSYPLILGIKGKAIFLDIVYFSVVMRSDVPGEK